MRLGTLRLITCIHAAELEVDPNEVESVLIHDARYARADFGRVVSTSTVRMIRFLHADGSEHAVRIDAAGVVKGHAFQGRSSIRRLVGGATQLDSLL